MIYQPAWAVQVFSWVLKCWIVHRKTQESVSASRFLTENTQGCGQFCQVLAVVPSQGCGQCCQVLWSVVSDAVVSPVRGCGQLFQVLWSVVLGAVRCCGQCCQGLPVVGSDPAPSTPRCPWRPLLCGTGEQDPATVSWVLFPGPALTSRTF